MREITMKTRKRRSGTGSLTTGIVLTITFGLLWLRMGFWWWIFPFVFGGVIPTINGIKRLFEKKISSGFNSRYSNYSAEKKILRIAYNNKGKITPALIALETELSLNRAEEILNDMAKKGHVYVSVMEEGRIEYSFPDFLPGKKS